MSFGKKALAILKGIAPVAAAAIGGPFAGPAMSIIAKAIGIGEDKVEDYILSANPDQLLALKKAEADLEKWRVEAGIRRDELEAQDRDSARQLARDKGIIVQAALSTLYTVGYFASLFMVLTGSVEIAAEQRELANALLTMLAAPQLQILNFWFGSSRGSKEKTAILANGSK